MKCHCGLECIVMHQDTIAHMRTGDSYYKCREHGFQGWVNTEGFELLD